MQISEFSQLHHLLHDFFQNIDVYRKDAALTCIAMTIQRLNGDLRSKTLELFERLLTLGFTSNSDTIKEFDIRPVPVIAARRRRRRSKD